MAERADFLIEIGTEELPPTALVALKDALAAGIEQRLDQLELEHGPARAFATPRRLAVLVPALSVRQPERTVERRGPAVDKAFDADGRPTRAAEGFARSCGVAVDALQRLETDKGEWLAYRGVQQGEDTARLLPQAVTEAVRTLPIPKRMRWGDGGEAFVRPVHWIVALLGHEVLDLTLFGVRADRVTYGHRFHHPDAIVIPDPDAYLAELADPGHVIADFERRRELIREQVEAAAVDAGGMALIEDDLLDEVTGLVEWPVALAGRFEARFLALPREVLIATLQGHQRYFPVAGRGEQAALLPVFVTVANIRSRQPEQVRIGNERVVRPRLADALFFWEQDRRQPFEAFVEGLDHLAFQQELGSVADKTARIQALAEAIAPETDADAALAQRAARLCKADLMTAMVYEFTELQGVMGRYYAEASGEPAEVAAALEEQYWPRHAGDRLPRTPVGRALALADRLDTLAGIFAIGKRPTGEKDPFALRRAALGVVRILIESDLDLDLNDLVARAVALQPGTRDDDAVTAEVLDFVQERMRSYYAGLDVAVEVFNAVAAVVTGRPRDFDRRVAAVQRFLALPEAERLAAAHKRVRNILKQAGDGEAGAVEPARLQAPAERALWEQAQALRETIDAHTARAAYGDALAELATLQAPVDRFFDEVMVMSDDPAQRRNRIALLAALDRLCRAVADISCLPG